MAPAPSNAAHLKVAPIGPGRVVLIVGPSGAGKDTLLGHARALLADTSAVVFATRVVTRPSSTAEDNIALSPEAFAEAEARGDFAVSWQAHGLSYAIPASINHDIAAGRTVVLNTSRTCVEAIKARYAVVAVVLIDAPLDVRAARLAARGREDIADVQARLSRAPTNFDARDADLLIDNVAGPADGGRRLAEFLAQAV